MQTIKKATGAVEVVGDIRVSVSEGPERRLFLVELQDTTSQRGQSPRSQPMDGGDSVGVGDDEDVSDLG